MSKEINEQRDSSESTIHDRDILLNECTMEDATLLLESLGTPEMAYIDTVTAEITQSIQWADQNWQQFLEQAKAEQFSSWWACKKSGNEMITNFAQCFTKAVALKEFVRSFFDTRIDALENQYRIIRRQYLTLQDKLPKWQPPTAEMIQLNEQMEAIRNLQSQYKQRASELLPILSDFVWLLKNKIDQHKVILYGMKYKGKRLFEKEDEDKIKIKAKKWTARDPENATKYLWWWPIHESGKCGITDMQIKKDAQTMKDIKKSAKRWWGEKRTWVVEWTPQTNQSVPEISLDDLATQMTELMTKIPELQTTLNAVQQK